MFYLDRWDEKSKATGYVPTKLQGKKCCFLTAKKTAGSAVRLSM